MCTTSLECTVYIQKQNISAASLKPNQARTVYLVMYTQAGFTKVPKRCRFPESMVNKFSKNGHYDQVKYWALTKETNKCQGYH